MSNGQKWFAIGGVILIALVIIGAVSDGLEPESKTMAQPSTTTTTIEQTTTTTRPVTTTTVATTTTEATSTTFPEWVADEAFVLTMRDASADLELVTWVDLVDDEYLIEWGNLFCFQMSEHGGVWQDAVLYALGAGVEAFEDAWNEDDTMMVAFGSGAAIQAYCPWYEVPDENPWG